MKRVAILGAAGRDCHNFNAVFRSNPTSKVVAFTATQIPDIADLCDPAAVTGERLPPNSEELVLSFKSIPTPKERIDLESQSGAHNYSPLEPRKILVAAKHRFYQLGVRGSNLLLVSGRQDP